MKNLKLFVILFSIIVTNLCFAQSGWFWQNPVPQGNDYEDVEFFDENTGYAVGWGNAIVKTTNSGINWSLVNNGVKELISIGGSSDIIKHLHVFDGNTIIAVGGGVIKSTNGGVSWVLLSSPFGAINDLFFSNINTGFAVYTNKIYKTTNGGINWDYSIINNNLRTLSFIDQYTGFIGCGDGNILKTTNTGINWYVLSSLPNFYINTIQFINSQTGFCGNGKAIYKTTNGGLNWSLKLEMNNSSGGKLSFSDVYTGYFCHWGGKIYKTINSGESWDSTFLTGLTLSLSSPNVNICVVVGSGGLIYTTTNSGILWNCVSSQLGDLGTLNLINCPTDEVAYITGNNGVMLKTTDSGNLWLKLNTDLNTTLTGLYFLNKDTGYSSNGIGNIYNTINGGMNWTFLCNINVNSPASNIYFLNSNTGFIVSHDKIFLTTNAGFNWTQNFRLAGSVIGNLHFINTQTGFCTINTGGIPPHARVFKTTNQGLNWLQISAHEYKRSAGFVMLNEIIGFISNDDVVGNNDMVEKTTNGGINWFPSLNYYGGSLFFIDESTGFTTAGFKTTDSGVSWSYHFSNIYPYFTKSIAFFNSNTGFIVGGYSGTIIKTTDGGGSGILVSLSNFPNAITKEFHLSQNYPNPFNPVTKIKFAIPANVKGQMSNVKLIIYDLLGREVTTLVNEELRPGTYEADWDGSDYSSGVYFYKLVVGDPSTSSGRGFVETKKMVLMK